MTTKPKKPEISNGELAPLTPDPAPPLHIPFASDLKNAQYYLTQIVDHLNLLALAYESAASLPPDQYAPLVAALSTKLLTAFTHYRTHSRSLTIHSRTAQENQQSASCVPSAEMARLERLQAELETTRAAVSRLVAPDYSVFRDLKMVSRAELEQLHPEMNWDMEGGDTQHKVLLAQMHHESERRRNAMRELEELEREKRTLQEQIKKRRETMAMANTDVDRCTELLKYLSQKLNIDADDMKQDLSELESPVLELFQALQERRSEVATSTADVEMLEVASSAVPTPEPPADVVVEDVAKEEGEASDEGEEEMTTT